MMGGSTYLLAAASALLVLYYSFRRRNIKNFPPGPKGSFLVGNLSAFQPEVDQKVTNIYEKWSNEYGNILHLQVLGKHIIVLNSAQTASDLMDKRAAIYSDRPRMPMLCELAGNDWVISHTSGELHKRQRALASRYFITQLKDWQSVQLDSARTLTRNISADTSNWEASIRLGFASSVLRLTYGYEVTRPDDNLLKTVQAALESPCVEPHLVDVFPWLKYYPSWLPGGQFHKVAEEAKILGEKIRHMPFDMVRDRMAAGKAPPSFVSTLLTQLPPDEDQEKSHQAGLIRDTAAAFYGAAMETTVSMIFGFFGLMVLHPDVQQRAQSELDALLGGDHLPTFDDRTSLPFIEAIILELIRWNIVTPLGFPHTVSRDDEYLGYHIPKGATVFGNIWAMLRDPVAFPNPDTFHPYRFLAETEGSATARNALEFAAFGWGKRACPGRHVGSSNLFIVISHILSCFEIGKSVDDAGNEVDLKLEQSNTYIIRLTFPPNCSVKVRRPDRIAMLNMLMPNST